MPLNKPFAVWAAFEDYQIVTFHLAPTSATHNGACAEFDGVLKAPTIKRQFARILAEALPLWEEIRYLATIFNWPTVNTAQATLLGIYIAAQAKKYVDGCGGETDALIIRSSGIGEEIERTRTSHIEEYLESGTNETAELFRILTKPDISETEMDLLLEAICQRIRDLKARL